MPEWEALLRKELRTADVPPGRLEEIIAELGGHLESAWEEQPGVGAAANPVSFLKAHLGNVARLRAKIERAEKSGDAMNDLKRFWMPAGLALSLIVVVIAAMLGAGPGMALVPPGSYPVAFALIGALSAFVTRRAGARRPYSFLAGVGVMLVLLLASAVQFSFIAPISEIALRMLRGMAWPLGCLAVGALAFSGDVTEERFKHFWGPAFLAICLSEMAAIWLHASWIPGFPRLIAWYAMGLAPSLRYAEVLLMFAAISGVTAALARRNGASRLWAFGAGIAPLWKFALYYLLLIFSAPELGSAPGFLFEFIWGTLLPVACTAASAYAFSFVPSGKQVTHQPC